MCLVAFAWKPGHNLHLMVAANRDEFHARPSLPLAAWADAPEILGGRDQTALGTWLGVSTRGRLAVVTNVRTPALQAAALRSRGSLAKDFLISSAGPITHQILIQPTLPDYSPCNFLMADAQDACYLSNQPGIAPRILVPGIYGMSNASLDTPWPKLLSVKGAMRRWFITGASLSDIEPLFAALANINQPRDDMLPNTGIGLERERELAPVFIRGPTYGTRCSSILWVTDKGEGCIIERRFGPGGASIGETQMHFRWPMPFRHS